MPALNSKQTETYMKYQEQEQAYQLDNDKTIVIRLDMRAGGTFVRGLQKPFDDAFTDAMKRTAQALAEQVQGTQLVYTGSDEITLILKQKGEKPFTPFFNGKLQKMVSLTASIATAAFNKAWLDIVNNTTDDARKDVLSSKLFTACFDSRAFELDNDWDSAFECVWWRVNDVRRNSVQMLARHYFSHRELQNVKVTEMLQKLDESGHSWESEVSMENKYGTILIHEAYNGTGYNPKTKEYVSTIRHAWFNATESELKEFQQVKCSEDFAHTSIYQRLVAED